MKSDFSTTHDVLAINTTGVPIDLTSAGRSPSGSITYTTSVDTTHVKIGLEKTEQATTDQPITATHTTGSVTHSNKLVLISVIVIAGLALLIAAAIILVWRFHRRKAAKKATEEMQRR